MLAGDTLQIQYRVFLQMNTYAVGVGLTTTSESFDFETSTPTPVPEPTTGAFVGAGLLLLGLRSRRSTSQL